MRLIAKQAGKKKGHAVMDMTARTMNDSLRRIARRDGGRARRSLTDFSENRQRPGGQCAQFTLLTNPGSLINASTLSLTVSSIAMVLLVNFGAFFRTVLVVENTTFRVVTSVTT